MATLDPNASRHEGILEAAKKGAKSIAAVTPVLSRFTREKKKDAISSPRWMDEPNKQAKAKPVPAARLFWRNGTELFGRMERKKPKNSLR